MDQIKKFLFYMLPLRGISRLFGVIANLRLPSPILSFILRFYVKKYKVNLEETDADLAHYSTINKFFTRSLHEGLRPVDTAPLSVVSPVDGKILTFGEIKEGEILQVKGESSKLDDLVDIPGYRKKFIDGHYVIIYLSPKDYHRIHSPVNGEISGLSYLPGKLFPVNTFAVNNIDRLFSRNERLITYMECRSKLFALVKVGATNVGSIQVNYAPDKKTNVSLAKAESQVFMKKLPIKKGEELGRFEMGSTVILLFEKGMVKLNSLTRYESVKYGEKIGSLL